MFIPSYQEYKLSMHLTTVDVGINPLVQVVFVVFFQVNILLFPYAQLIFKEWGVIWFTS